MFLLMLGLCLGFMEDVYSYKQFIYNELRSIKEGIQKEAILACETETQG